VKDRYLRYSLNSIPFRLSGLSSKPRRTTKLSEASVYRRPGSRSCPTGGVQVRSASDVVRPVICKRGNGADGALGDHAAP